MTASLSVARGTMGEAGTGRGRRASWAVFAGLVLLVVVVTLATMRTGTGRDPRVANPRPGPAQPTSALSSPVGSSILTGAEVVVLFGVLSRWSWRRRSLHWAAVIALGTLGCGLIDPLANWATFASLNPRVPHFPTSWWWFRLAPLCEPALSFLGGYSGYYLLTGLGVYWLATRLLLRRLPPPSSWAGRHPLAALFVAGYFVSLPFNALLQLQWLRSGVLVYTRFYGPTWRVGNHVLPLLELLYDPFIYATVAVLCHRDGQGRSTVLTWVAARLPRRGGRSTVTAGRQVIAASCVMVPSILVPIGAFSAVRGAGLAHHAGHERFPFPDAKVYDPYGDLRRAGKPGPFLR